MAKPEINYRVIKRPDPITGGVALCPQIVDRSRAVPLDEVIETAIDRGLIVAVKANAAKSIAEGVAEELYHQFSLGNGIAFGKYFYGRLYLKGTLENESSPIASSNNQVNVRLMKGEDFRLSLSDFSWHNVDEQTDVKIFNIQTVGGRTPNTIAAGQAFAIYGLNLKCGVTGDSLVAAWKVGDTPATATLEIGENDSGHIDVAWSEAFGEIEPGTVVNFTLTNHPDGAEKPAVVTQHSAVVA